MKYIKIFENFNNIICYHRSNDFKHMVRNDFKLEMSDEVALFGNAIYFCDVADISYQLGKYVCKFSINLKEPVLDMNKKISSEEELIGLFKKFNQMFNLDIDYIDVNFDNLSGKFNVQYGEFFNDISETFNWDYNKYYKEFIISLGYNSFKYFGTYHTDFRAEKGDYGICYGIYDVNDIKFVDGPF